MNEGMVNGAHTRHFSTRSFYASNGHTNIELNASKSDIATWYNEFKAFHIIVPGKTYVQALLNNVNIKAKKLQRISKCTKVANQNICLNVVKHKVGHPNVMEAKQTIHPNNCKHSKVTDQHGSVAGAKTIEQNFRTH